MTTTETRSYEAGEQVTFEGQRRTVTFVDYNNQRRHTCGHVHNWYYLDGLSYTAPECQLTPAPAGMAEGEMRQRHATHATITVTYVGGPERLYRVAVTYTGTAREVDGLTYGARDYDRAAALGNALVDLFNTITVAQALDALPAMTNILNLAA